MAKRIIITGATNGIGRATTKLLLEKGFEVVMLVRNEQKANQVVEELKQETGNENCFYELVDLADLNSVKTVCELILKKYHHVDVLINNAGGIFQERQLSKQGVEMHFALNHLAHFYLFKQLFPLLMKSKTRVLNVSSEAHRVANLDLQDINVESSYGAMKVYGNAKLCNILFTKCIANKYAEDGIESYALHPGVVRTGFAMNSTGVWKQVFKLIRPFISSPEEGAANSVFLASQEEILAESGSYFKNKKKITSSRASMNPELRESLWRLSERILKEKGF